MADLRTRIGGIPLDNPVLIASGPLSDTPEILRKVDDFGAGGVILKSPLTEKDYERAVKPFAKYTFPRKLGSYIRCEDGQMHFDGMSRWSVEKWAEWLPKNMKNYRMKLIGSIAGTSLEGYIEGAKILEQAGVPAIEILMACPAQWFRPFRYSMNTDPSTITEICTEVVKAVKIPVGAKVYPYPRSLANAAIKSGCKWVTLGGIFIGAPSIDLDTIEPKFALETSIAGTSVAKYMAFRSMLYAKDIAKNVDISGHGGIHNWQDSAEMIMYGANSVQILTALMRKGLRVIKSVNNGLSHYMDEKGFANIEAMRGVILPKLVPSEKVAQMVNGTYPRLKGTVVSKVDPEICNGCEICEEVCPFDAIKLVNKIAVTDKKKCDGCEMCVMACPVNAIVLENKDLLRREERKAVGMLR